MDNNYIRRDLVDEQIHEKEKIFDESKKEVEVVSSSSVIPETEDQRLERERTSWKNAERAECSNSYPDYYLG